MPVLPFIRTAYSKIITLLKNSTLAVHFKKKNPLSLSIKEGLKNLLEWKHEEKAIQQENDQNSD